MKKLLTVTDSNYKGQCGEGFNALTTEMQKYFDGDFMKKHDRTYVFEPVKYQEQYAGKMYYPLRHPGSTIGHIQVDKDGIIIDIEIYQTYMSGKSIPNTAVPYTLEVRDMVKKYIGCKYECLGINLNEKDILVCDYHELFDKELREQVNKHEGVTVEFPDGSWFKFCDNCVRDHGLMNMVNELRKKEEEEIC